MPIKGFSDNGNCNLYSFSCLVFFLPHLVCPLRGFVKMVIFIVVILLRGVLSSSSGVPIAGFSGNCDVLVL